MNKVFLFLPLFIFIATRPLAAEYLCHSEISYKWKKHPAEKGANADPNEAQDIQVFATTIAKPGADEAAAKAALQDIVGSEKSKALEACKKDHEDLSACIFEKFTNFNNVHQNLGFSARKALEDAITSDCEAQQGICIEAAASDPVCVDKSPPATPAGKDSGKKDEGKKK